MRSDLRRLSLMALAPFVAAVAVPTHAAGVPAGRALDSVSVSSRAHTPLGSSQGAENDRPVDVPDGMEWDPERGLQDDPLAIDAAFIASQDGRSTADVLAELRAQHNMDSILPAAEDRFPTLVAIYWIDHDHVVAQFTEQPSKEALDYLEAAGASVSSEIVGLTAADLDRVQSDVESVLDQLGAANTDWTAGQDPRSQRVLVSVAASAGIAPEDIINGLPDPDVQDHLKIDLVDGPVGALFVGNGGAEYYTPISFQCTTGFSVFQGATIGLATAGHCGTSINAYVDWPVSGVYGASYVNGFGGNWGDFEWFTTTDTEVDDFYHTNGGAIRDVTGVKNTFSVGDSVSMYGRGTFQEATGTVAYTNYTFAGIGKQVCTSQALMGHGDSGGPVYSSGVAAGFIEGGPVIDGSVRLCFSKARYIDDAIGVTIKQT